MRRYVYEAAGHGWYPTDQTWLGSRLTVAYAYRRRSRRARRSDGTLRTLPLWMRVTYRAVVLGTATAAIILLIWVLGALALDGGIS